MDSRASGRTSSISSELPFDSSPVMKPSPCAICRTELSLNQCHRCPLCGQVVCGGCSPSRLQLPGSAQLCRACNACIAGPTLLDDDAGLRRRMSQLADQMSMLSNRPPPEVRGNDVEETIAACNAAAEALGRRLHEIALQKEAAVQAAQRAEAQAKSDERSRADIAAAHAAVEAALLESEEDTKRHLKEMADAIARICDRLRRLASDGHTLPEPTVPPASVAEAGELCEAALRPVEHIFRRAEAKSKLAADSLMYHAAEAAFAPPPAAPPRPPVNPRAVPSDPEDDEEGGKCRVAAQCRVM